MIATPIIISADEINCLIYSYFQDSGFNHSAFALRNEGRLQNSPFFTKHIPRGELIDLLSKALLYLEVESHWRTDGLTNNCKTNFSLLEPHVCSLAEPSEKPTSGHDIPMDVSETGRLPLTGLPSISTGMQPYAKSQASRNGAQIFDGRSLEQQEAEPFGSPTFLNERQPQTLGLSSDGIKRKTSPIPVDGPVEKRARRDSGDMDVDTISEPMRSKTPPQEVAFWFQQSALTKIEDRPQGPGDAKTDPRVILLLPGHKTEVFVCAFNPKMHNLLASGSKDATVNLWNLPDPPPPRSEKFADAPGEPLIMENVSKAGRQGDLTSLDWSSDGTLLAIGSYDSILRVCTNTGSIYFTHPQHQGPIFAARFSKNGAWLLTASLDGTTCLWDVKDKRLHKQYRCHKDCCLDVEWINENTFASAGADTRIFIMRIDEDEPIKTFNGHKDEVNQIRVNQSGTRLASCSDDGAAYIWRVDNVKRDSDSVPGLSTSDHVVALKGHGHSVSTVGWCVDHPAGTNELIATSSFDGTARLWDSVTGECLNVFRDHKAPLYSLTFSPDGKFFATGSGDGWLHIYHTRSYARVWSWFGGTEKPGVFEIDWQEHEGISRIAMALESRQVAVLDVNKLEAFCSPELPSGRIEDA
ncbi:hypothetical protein M413DRAFT_204575 [Hebeloma cylindrosporum]|uniref:LisH domain-containing protein n=1 Tax=Hebeloma cylindrosporum TaxID=76867 RepID=A0A0C3CU42_HEBCY|nr:hypothetical protein M413DRAFT_204575 [Hebeloma cylindrosporum h7]